MKDDIFPSWLQITRPESEFDLSHRDITNSKEDFFEYWKYLLSVCREVKGRMQGRFSTQDISDGIELTISSFLLNPPKKRINYKLIKLRAQSRVIGLARHRVVEKKYDKYRKAKKANTKRLDKISREELQEIVHTAISELCDLCKGLIKEMALNGERIFWDMSPSSKSRHYGECKEKLRAVLYSYGITEVADFT